MVKACAIYVFDLMTNKCKGHSQGHVLYHSAY